MWLDQSVVLPRVLFQQVRSIDSALLSAEEQDLVDTDDTDSSFRPYRGGALQPSYLSASSSRLDDRRMSSARRATAVSAARRMSSMANLNQVILFKPDFTDDAVEYHGRGPQSTPLGSLPIIPEEFRIFSSGIVGSM